MTAYSAAFLAAVAETLRQEGGYANRPEDPGGETNFGISKRAYPNLHIRALRRDDAIAIYHRDYWLPVHGDELPFPIALVLFDSRVNGGAPVRWLQEALGVAIDGVLGPQTHAALAAADIPALVGRVLRRRVLYLASLPNWSIEKKGWVQRCFDIHRVALTPPTSL